jgi:non-ribosomal peptide synthetase component E (peptide arylation enzyme)
MAAEHGWVVYTSGDNSHLSPELRVEVEGRMKQRQEDRGGALMAIVEVRVYENEVEPQVSFPQDALLGPDTDSSIISDVVARAREQLSDWR